MAGRPFMRKIIKLIEENGGPEWVGDMIADGATVGDVARALGCSRRYVYYVRDAAHWQGRFKEIWDEAMKLSAEAQIEKAMAEYDRLDRVIDTDENGAPIHRVPQAAEVQLVSGRAKFRQWLASRRDPDKYGEYQKGVNVNLNIGSLHLDALESIKAREALPARTPEVIEAEVEDE